MKRPIVIIARAVEEVKGGAVLPAAKVAVVVKAIVRAVVPHQNHPSHEMRSRQEKRVSMTLVSL
jgi:hypothetical protein